MKILFAAFIVIVGMGTAYAGGFMMLHIGSADGSGALQNGKILLADGTSFILQTDAVSKICRAGGC